MSKLEYEDYEDPQVEEQWCLERRAEVERYLRSQGVEHGEIGEWPAWLLAPYVSIWAIESRKWPGRIGWWVITGDLPTDYISGKEIRHPREAMRRFAEIWTEAATYMQRGEDHPDVKIGSPGWQKELAPLLAGRAEMLLDWATDDAVWVEDEDEDDAPEAESEADQD